ncbi:hypothetical protein B4064_3242 [Caldibacillus thermoamylovorans]|jgi:hypothetical protein|uniref:Uncharacterized protein n=1 Tax=Caldibacillus thermoamylovorans TaxID=35841 RepID=A0A0D0G418_9BACI|nr:hypothetical protein B4065_1040 [Caldibacillus thermoamylovorans]KIO63412.1 hypothetical protein B4064_3242 [Caldibacillus thermoamylovorans]KIO69743.1 hypothetical protein B4166_0343 [Caldibacillus thermoamylovorans]KIO71932.1 hypothetical protein B4167_0347 [Caldibacillus thermoamylovorans]
MFQLQNIIADLDITLGLIGISDIGELNPSILGRAKWNNPISP